MVVVEGKGNEETDTTHPLSFISKALLFGGLPL